MLMKRLQVLLPPRLASAIDRKAFPPSPYTHPISFRPLATLLTSGTDFSGALSCNGPLLQKQAV